MEPLTPALDSRASLPSAIVLFDLDATLFDYIGLRLRATSVALEGVVSDPELTSRELLDLLRQPFTGILGSLTGLPDLRREWDSPEVLALGCMLNEPSARRALTGLAGAAAKFGIPEEDVSLKSRVQSFQHAQELRESSLGTRFIGALARVREKQSRFFADHLQSFREYVTEHASLAEGARELIARLMDLGGEVHVVSEGDTAIQTFKFHSLGLKGLVETCVVTDATCGVSPILTDLFNFYKDSGDLPQEVVQLYDQLSPYTIKSQAFFSKLLHALRDPVGGNLLERMQSVHFCTGQEWQTSRAFSVVMIGDRYRKDLEPLLQIAPAGVKAYRLLTGRYSREDPLDELMAERRPLPHGVFGGFHELGFLTTALATPGDPVAWPLPVLPDPSLADRVLKRRSDALSPASRTTLARLQSEALRHQNNE